MTTFHNKVNAFGDSPGDDMHKHDTKYGGRGVLPSGKLKHYPGEVANIATGNRRLAKAKVGTGGMVTGFRGTNAFSKKK